jgi:hypothetical protein
VAINRRFLMKNKGRNHGGTNKKTSANPPVQFTKDNQAPQVPPAGTNAKNQFR